MDLLKSGFVACLLFSVAFQVCVQIGLPLAKTLIHSVLISLSTAFVFYNSTQKKVRFRISTCLTVLSVLSVFNIPKRGQALYSLLSAYL